MDLTPSQLDTLRHMLGINDPTQSEARPYRNHYCASLTDTRKLDSLAALGLVEIYKRDNGYLWYHCTPAGREAALASFPTFRYSRSKRRYLAFLRTREYYPDLTFKVFLTSSEHASARDVR